jgi:hypothetical protein
MALISRDFDDFFRRVIRAMEPYLPDLVIAGGCANALYRHHPQATATPIPRPMTKDLDLACEPTSLGLAGRRPLGDLIRQAGLSAKLYGQTNPPVMKFSLEGSETGPEVELLCPLVGTPQRTSEGEVQAIALQDGGVTAQPLRYLDLLLFEPWVIDLARVPGFGDLTQMLSLRIPQPLTYVMQKVLSRDEPGRAPGKREKDCYYIYEASVVFRDALGSIAAALPALLGPFPDPWIGRFIREMASLFRTPQSEGPVSAARVARASAVGLPRAPRIDEEMVHASVDRLISDIKSARDQ